MPTEYVGAQRWAPIDRLSGRLSFLCPPDKQRKNRGAIVAPLGLTDQGAVGDQGPYQEAKQGSITILAPAGGRANRVSADLRETFPAFCTRRRRTAPASGFGSR